VKIHPLNLALRFLLELVVLFVSIEWALRSVNHWSRYVWMLLLPLGLALIWWAFNVPGDPSRSGNTVIRVAGWFRLILEWLIFGLGIWFMYNIDYLLASVLFGALVVLHYLLSFNRILWLLRGR
jgi:hypothetical protein